MKLNIYRGDDASFKIYLTKPALLAQDQAYHFLFDLTEVPPSGQVTPYVIPAGASVTVNFQSAAGSPNVNISVGSGVTLGVLTNGELDCVLSHAQSALLKPGLDLPIDIVLTDLSGNKQTFERNFCLNVLDRQNQ